ncbi:MAG: alpha-amylase family glycosyl hydrolase [Anaerolineae bacterium]
MPNSVWSAETRSVVAQARVPRTIPVKVGSATVKVPSPFPSPEDWRDRWIYEILVDRFNNPGAPPRAQWDGAINTFQGGTFNGIRQQLDYLRDLGVGAIWLTPVLKNCQWTPETYHGYGIQDFLSVDPRFASRPELAETELRALVDEAHARGMHVIFDIVLNHSGDVFEYAGWGGTAPWSDTPYRLNWRDETGQGRPDWGDHPQNPAPDAAIWPVELQDENVFRRQGNAFSRPSDLQDQGGDFFSLKQFDPDYIPDGAVNYPARAILIHAYQYIIAKFDVDGFRIDTLKYLPADFAQTFGNAVREYALSIGKKNFFTYGEVYDGESKISGYIGRNTFTDDGDLIGVDAALDFPLFFKLPQMVKGFLPPSDVVNMYEYRKEVERGVLSSHGEASRFFVTFLDNHDQYQRLYYSDPANPRQFDDQVALGVACLFALQGIPCIYYGTEQGLHGAGNALEAVREALWGKPGAFDRQHPFYLTIQQLAAVRAGQPTLRYGRQYFRPISGDGFHFGLSTAAPGVFAFSRILQDQEVLVVANLAGAPWTGEVIVDSAVNPVDSHFVLLFSNKSKGGGQTGANPPGAVVQKPIGGVQVLEANGSVGSGPVHSLRITLQPLEIQILGQVSPF